jgi:FdhD protein
VKICPWRVEVIALSDFLPKLSSFRTVQVKRFREGVGAEVPDEVAEEVPVGLEYNGVPHVVMLATPDHLEDFGRGFSLTEGIVKSVKEISSVAVESYSDGIRVMMTLPEGSFSKLERRRQNLAGRTGCGLCGTEQLAQVFRPMRPVTSAFTLNPEALPVALAQLPGFQPLQQVTGATHGAFWLDAQGNILLGREDVGRHNALDKLVGAMAAEGHSFAEGALLITSRASYEMVQKSIQMNIGLIIALSAPTALAIRMAQDFNVTLVGFARAGGHVIYTHPQRLHSGALAVHEQGD